MIVLFLLKMGSTVPQSYTHVHVHVLVHVFHTQGRSDIICVVWLMQYNSYLTATLHVHAYQGFIQGARKGGGANMPPPKQHIPSLPLPRVEAA